MILQDLQCFMLEVVVDLEMVPEVLVEMVVEAQEVVPQLVSLDVEV